MTRASYAALMQGKKPRRSDEETDQRALIKHLRLRADRRVVFFAVPNGEHRSKATGARLKAAGVLAGVADIILFLPDASVFCLEMKTRDGKQSPAQIDFQSRCEAIGVNYAVAYGLDHALQILEGIGVLPPSA